MQSILYYNDNMESITHTVDEEGREWKVVVLPDDPKLTPQAARRRAIHNSKAWRRKRFTPRSVSKPHQHHLLTEVLD